MKNEPQSLSTPPPIPFIDEAKWPLTRLLITGYFGTQSPEGRRYNNRNVVAGVVTLLLFVPWPWLGWKLPWLPVDRIFETLEWVLPGALFSFIAWSFWRYLGELDELARGIQLQAACLTYLTGMAAVAFLGPLAGLENFHINPIYFIVVLEPVRGFWLWIVARRYQA